jgi:hypothetical protein
VCVCVCVCVCVWLCLCVAVSVSVSVCARVEGWGEGGDTHAGVHGARLGESLAGSPL